MSQAMLKVADDFRMPASRARMLQLLQGGRFKLSEAERAALRRLQFEYQRDAEIEDHPVYSEMLAALNEELDPDSLFAALVQPEERISSGAGFPLTSHELAELCQSVGVDIEFKTIDRLAKAELISPALVFGTSGLPRNAYFARHFVEVLYRHAIGTRREVGVAHLQVLRRTISRREALAYAVLPGVDPSDLGLELPAERGRSRD